MGWLGRRQAVATAPETGVVLDLSGPRLRRAVPLRFQREKYLFVQKY